MRISLSWINELLGIQSLPVSAEDLAAQLTLKVVEIEGIERSGPNLNGVIVAKVLSTAKHPEADRLTICQVSTGTKTVQVVCGAPNVAADQTVALATVGTVLNLKGKDGSVSPVTIKPAKLRGVPSEGMICAEDELGLGTSHDGILVLDSKLTLGQPLTQALGLGDTVLTVENHALSHRPDLWGHLGWAREIAAVLGLTPPKVPSITWETVGQGMTVEIHSAACHAYVGALVEGVDGSQESPKHLKDRLEACGLRPLGLIVDLTNLVMLELGQPMHAFDRRYISGERIVVRSATKSEPFATLDGRKHTLTDTDLLIADEKTGLALAGIMGGEGSMVRPDTKSLVLESASFQAAGLRRTRMRLGLSSDAAARFEKTLTPVLAPAAMNRFLTYLKQTVPTAVIRCQFHAGAISDPKRSVSFDPALLKRRTGLDIPEDQQRQYLNSLGIETQSNTALIPWWRHRDLEESYDLVEEIARLVGFEKITECLPAVTLATVRRCSLRRAQGALRSRLSAQGWDEVQTPIFVSQDWAEVLAWDSEKLLRLTNPLSSGQDILRADLLPALLEAAGRNARNFSSFGIYEIGKGYGKGKKSDWTPNEEWLLAGAFYHQDKLSPFYQARNAALAAVEALTGQVANLVPLDTDPRLIAGRAASILIGKTVFGVVGEVAPTLAKRADLPGPVAIFTLELEAILAAHPAVKPPQHVTPSRFQAVRREFTFLCPEALPFEQLAKAAQKGAGNLGRKVELVTIWRGEGVEAGKKAVSFAITLQSDEATLTEKDLSRTQERILSVVTHTTGAVLKL